MGEGWGDYIATSVRSTSTYEDYPIAAWAANTKRGIRHFPYAKVSAVRDWIIFMLINVTKNSTVNPSMYDYLQRVDYREVVSATSPWGALLAYHLIFQHAIGEVWAEILWVVSNTLIEKHGFANSLFPSAETEFYRTYVRNGASLTRAPKHGNTLMLQ